MRWLFYAFARQSGQDRLMCLWCNDNLNDKDKTTAFLLLPIYFYDEIEH
jgi:hypothetical protein